MAAKRKTSKEQEESSAVPQVKVQLTRPADATSKYANYVHVARSPYDIELTFWRIPSVARDPGAPDAKVIERRGEFLTTLILPYEVARGLIKAMQTTWDGFISDDSQPLSDAYKQWESHAFERST